MRKLLGLVPALGLAVGLLGVSSVAHAAEVTRVATAFEEDNPFDLHFGVGYDFDFKSAAILREQGSNGENRLVRDLVYQQMRHTVTPTLEIGLYHDLAFYAALPIVVSDNREYSFDQADGDDCVFPEGANPGQAPTCVNKTNSTTLRDEIVPTDGFDARTPDSPFTQFTADNTEKIFRGPTRRGLDQLHIGLKYGVLKQKKRSHMPDFVIGFEGRFAVAKPMTFTRDIRVRDPDGNHRVGRGIHELGVWATLARRYRYMEPFFGAYWRAALRAANSQFKSYPGAADRPNPQSTAGSFFGVEIVPWERKARSRKVSVIVAGSAILRYGGRDYSEIWELLADSPALVGSVSPGTAPCGREAIEAAKAYAAANPTDPSGYLEAANAHPDGGGCTTYNGITNVQDYGTFGLNAALNFHMGPYARLNFGARISTNTQHFLTYAGRGDADSTGDPDVVEPNSSDVNPLRRDVVDSVGRRYALDDVLNVVAFANLLFTF